VRNCHQPNSLLQGIWQRSFSVEALILQTSAQNLQIWPQTQGMPQGFEGICS